MIKYQFNILEQCKKFPDIFRFFMNVSTIYLCAISSFPPSPASISHSFLVSFPPISLSITPTNSSWKGLALVQNPNDHPSQKCQWMEIRQHHQTEDWSVVLRASEKLRLCAERRRVVFTPLLPSQRPGEGYKSAVKSEVPPADWCIIECLFRTFLKALALIILILQCNSGFLPNQKNLCPVRFTHQSQCGWMVFNIRELVSKVKKGNEIMLQRFKFTSGVLV